MRKFMMFTLIVWVNVIFCQSAWQIMRNPWTWHFTDVCFLPGTQTGWAVGASFHDTNMTYLGGVAHTTDGGRTWFPQMAEGNAICFVDENHGWTVGDVVYHTDDGGQIWVNQFSPPATLHGVSFINDSLGWAFGLYGYVLHTTDAGNTWIVQYQFPNELWIMDGIFKDRLTGWVAGYTGPAEGKIYKTTDGGNSWFILAPGTNGNFYGIDFYDLNYGWAVTSGLGIVTRTTDGGATWSPQFVYDHSLLEVKFADALNGWVVGGDNAGYSGIFYSSDGGITWNQQYDPTHNELWSVSAADAQNAWAVGLNGTILHASDAGNTWEYQAEGSGNTLFGIDAPDTLNIWATGDWGRVVLHSNDGGFTWIHQDVGDGYGYLYDVSFSDALHGAVVGGFGLIYTTSDGGATWTLRDAGNSAWYGVEFVDSLKGWVATVSSGVIKHTQDGGNTWDYQYSTSGQYFMDIMFLSDRLGWACGFTMGSNSVVVRTTDGQTWNPYTLPTQRVMNSVDFVSPDLGFVVGDNGEIYRSQDGGATWGPLHNDTLGTSDLYRVDFVDSLNGWIVSQDKIFRTKDGGNTWNTDREINFSGPGNAKGLVCLDTLHAFVCVGDGKILRYGTLTGIEEEYQISNIKCQMPKLQVYPNPFCDKIDIRCSILTCPASQGEAGDAGYWKGKGNQQSAIKIYDATGRLVKNFNFPTPDALRPTFITWQGDDDFGRKLPAGVYFCQLKYGDKKETKKIIRVQ